MPNVPDPNKNPAGAGEGQPIAGRETDAELKKKRMAREAMHDAEKAGKEMKRDEAGTVKPTWP